MHELEFLKNKLIIRKENNSFRELKLFNHTCTNKNIIDFSSNDYLGLARSDLLKNSADKICNEFNARNNGSTGSRLISGNSPLHQFAEKKAAGFFNSERTLIFGCGYMANLGLMSCIATRHDTIIYDEFIHASLRDGIRLSNAQNYSFRHNDLGDLEKKIKKSKGEVFIVIETLYSMDGDEPDLKELVRLAESKGCHLIADEAHSVGLFGNQGRGLINQYNLENKFLARIFPFGKAMGNYGAIISGSEALIEYLINFSRPFIYNTALPNINIAMMLASLNIIPTLDNERKILFENIQYFQNSEKKFKPHNSTLTPIQVIFIPDNNKIKKMSQILSEKSLYVVPILAPTVPEGSERFRITIHSYNTKKEIDLLINSLAIDV